MAAKLRIAVLLLLVGLAGCGSSTAPAAQSSTSEYINVTGNWTFGVPATPTSFSTTPVDSVFGSLASSGSTVTGILRADALMLPFCVADTTDLAASGTLDTSGNLTLTFPIAGGTGSLSGNFTESSTHTILSGTYQVVGGACAQSAVAMTFYEALNVTGTYSGTVSAGTGTPTSTVTAVLVQSAAPNSDGEYTLSGTVTSVGACNSTLTFNQGLVFGNEAQSFPYPQDPVPNDGFVAVIPAYDTEFFPIAIFIQPTGCGPGQYEGTLNRQ